MNFFVKQVCRGWGISGFGFRFLWVLGFRSLGVERCSETSLPVPPQRLVILECEDMP